MVKSSFHLYFLSSHHLYSIFLSQVKINPILCPDKNLTWANDKVKALGVWFCVNQEERLKKNYEEKIRNVENVLNNWHKKRLMLIGKIAVVNAVAASQMVYVISSMCSCLKSSKETNDLILSSFGITRKTKLNELE